MTTTRAAIIDHITWTMADQYMGAAEARRINESLHGWGGVYGINGENVIIESFALSAEEMDAALREAHRRRLMTPSQILAGD